MYSPKRGNIHETDVAPQSLRLTAGAPWGSFWIQGSLVRFQAVLRLPLWKLSQSEVLAHLIKGWYRLRSGERKVWPKGFGF